MRRADPARPGWDVGDYLSARLVDAVEHLAWITELVNTPKQRRSAVRHPEPVRRPTIPTASATPAAPTRKDWRARLAATASDAGTVTVITEEEDADGR